MRHIIRDEEEMAARQQEIFSRSSRKGFVLPTVILAITVMSLIVIVAISTASDERRASRATRESTLAMYAAEAGLRQTYGNWPAAANTLQPGDSLDLGWQNLPNKAAYRPVIHRVDNGGLQEYSVVVQGRRTDPTAGIITIVGAAGGVPIFKYAVRTQGILNLNTLGAFDAFDSDLGPYSLATADTLANVWANGNISVTRTTVEGSASAAGAITFGTSGVVTGQTASGATALTPPDILPCPAGGFTPTAKVPGGAGISYNSATGVVTVSGGATLTLSDTSYFFSSIVVTGTSKLVFSGNPQATVNLSDSLNAGGKIINSSGNAAGLSFSSCGTSATPADWALSSGGFAPYYSVYAPNHVVNQTGPGDFYGAVVASAYYATGGAKFHYDEALARQSSNKISVQSGSWAQIPGN